MTRFRRLIVAAATCMGALGAAGSVRAEPLVNPQAVSWGANRLDIFAVGGNTGALYHKAWDGASWYPAQNGPWEYLGGSVSGTPAVVSWGPNRLDIFVVSGDGALYQKTWDGAQWKPSQTDFQRLGGSITGSPTAVSWGANRLDIFATEAGDHALIHKAWDGASWYPAQDGPWENLGGSIIGSPKAVSWGPNRLDIFVVSGDGALYQKTWNGSPPWKPSQTDFQRLGGSITGSPTAVSWGANRLDIFATEAGDHALIHKAWDGANWYPAQDGPWENLGGDFGGFAPGSPTAVSWGPNRLDIFAPGGIYGILFHKAWGGSPPWYPSQTGFESLGGPITGSPTAVSWGPNRLDIFAVGSDGAVYHKGWDGSGAWYPSQLDWQRLGDGAVPTISVTTVPNQLGGYVDVVGKDFSPNTNVEIFYDNVPGLSGPTGGGLATTDSNGHFTHRATERCAGRQPAPSVTVRAVDDRSGLSATGETSAFNCP